MVTDNVFNKNTKKQEKELNKENGTSTHVSIALCWKERMCPLILFQVFHCGRLVWCFLMDAAYLHGIIMKFPKKVLCNAFRRKLRGK